MTTVFPPLAIEQPAHVTARIFVAETHATADQDAAPPGYVGRHRAPEDLPEPEDLSEPEPDRPSKLGLGVLLGFFGAAVGVAAVFGIQLFSAAW